MDEVYEDENVRYVWGIKSWDDLTSGEDANLWTMNDFDITYLKKEKKVCSRS